MPRRSILISCAALAFLSGVAPAAPRELRAGSGRIAFIRFNEEIGHPRLWVLPAGHHRATEVRLPLVAVDGPSWSADGKSIIFVGGRNQPDQPRVTEADDLYVVTVATGALKRVTNDSAHEAGVTFAPSGTRFAFVGSRASAPNRSSLFVSSLAGGRPHRLTFGNTDLEPSWSASGSWIAFLRIDQRKRTSGIWVVRPDGSGLHEILTGMTNATDPVWAPRGNRLLVSDGHRLVLTRADGSGRRIVAPLAADASGTRIDPEPSFSPDGSSIVYVQARVDAKGHADLWRVALTGGRPQRLTLSPGQDLSPAWG